MPLFMQPFAKYADFSGRARRAEYWQFMALQFVVYVGCAFAFGFYWRSAPITACAALAIGALFALLTLLPNLAVMVRRLHDTGRSIWWLLLYVPFLANIFLTGCQIYWLRERGITDLHQAGHNPVLGICCLIARVYLLYLMRKPGDSGPNTFGPDPKGGMDIASYFDAPEPPEPEVHRPIFDFTSAAPAVAQPPSRPVAENGFPTPSGQARTTFGKRRS